MNFGKVAIFLLLQPLKTEKSVVFSTYILVWLSSLFFRSDLCRNVLFLDASNLFIFYYCSQSAAFEVLITFCC